MPEDKTERLQKVLAQAGVASRRECEKLITAGRVIVNGQVVTRLGTKIDPAHDEVRVDGRPLALDQAGAAVSEARTYVLLNKPAGVVSAMRDPRGRRALGDLVTLPVRLYPVGRLDYDSEGLILLTNDGELANVLTHPRYEHDKEYRVTVAGKPADAALAAWRRGVLLEGKPTAPARVDVLEQGKETTVLRVVMHEGRKRQIRRVADLLGHPVRELVRVRLGPLKLGSLDSGQWRYLTRRELASLQALNRIAAANKEREED